MASLSLKNIYKIYEGNVTALPATTFNSSLVVNSIDGVKSKSIIYRVTYF